MNKLLLILSMVIVTFGLNAQHHDTDSHHGHDTDHHEEDHFCKFHVAVFNGATTNFDHNITGYTLGIEFEYRPIQYVGIGIGYENIFVDKVEFVFSVPVFVHPYKGLKVVMAPLGVVVNNSGETHNDSHKSGGADASSDSGNTIHYGGRLGLGYDFHVSKLCVGPFISMDWVNKTSSLVYGVSLGIGF